ncbi:MAG TPA: hypothetical protein VGT61_02760 [Thermomicrobiales bacterium]|nr:hypothetical protein [Thermomicrobiales bacterium]
MPEMPDRSDFGRDQSPEHDEAAADALGARLDAHVLARRGRTDGRRVAGRPHP